MKEELKKEKTKIFIEMVQEDIKENNLGIFFDQGTLKSQTT